MVEGGSRWRATAVLAVALTGCGGGGEGTSGRTSGSTTGYRIHLLISGSPRPANKIAVTIGDADAGQVLRVTRRGDQTDVEVQIEDRYAPVETSTTAKVQEQKLELFPGSRGSPQVADGGSLRLRCTGSSCRPNYGR
jgi:hypothetical protein